VQDKSDLLSLFRNSLNSLFDVGVRCLAFDVLFFLILGCTALIDMFIAAKHFSVSAHLGIQIINLQNRRIQQGLSDNDPA